LIDHEGYNLSLVDHKRTMFAIDGAPDEANCSVVYQDAYDSFNQFITVTIKDTGC
jgi:hypothetical protein